MQIIIDVNGGTSTMVIWAHNLSFKPTQLVPDDAKIETTNNIVS